MITKSQKGKLPRFDSGNHVKKLDPSESNLGYSVAGNSAAVEIDYFNYTNKDVIIVDHTGLALKFKPLNFTPRKAVLINKFVVRKKIKLAKSTIAADMSCAVKAKNNVYTKEIVSSNEDLFSEKLLSINETITTISGGESNNIYFIEPDSLNEPIYIRDVDVLVYDAKYTGDVIHPNSVRAIEAKIEQLHEDTYSYNIEINDPEWLSDYYYLNMNDKVVTITPSRNSNMPAEANLSFKSPGEPLDLLFTGELNEVKLNEVGIYKTFKEASDSKNKIELLKESLEYQRMMDSHQKTVEGAESAHLYKMNELSNKMEVNNQSHKIALEKLEEDHRKLLRDLEFERIKNEESVKMNAMKDYYDQRSHERKDSSEGLKFLPTLLGAGLALFGVYAGVKK